MTGARKGRLAEMVAEMKRQNTEALAQARALAAPGLPIRFIGDDDRRALASADMSEPGMFRVTRFDALGPIGHTQYHSLEEAALDALRSGYHAAPKEPV